MTSMATERTLSSDVGNERLEMLEVLDQDIIEGEPTTALAALTRVQAIEIGIWEITPGVVVDIEADEVLVVLEGLAEVAFDDGSVLLLQPGVVARLRAGDRTTWTVRRTLRKVFVLFPPA